MTTEPTSSTSTTIITATVSIPPPLEQMPQPGAFLGTPYKTEEGLFEYPFPTPPLPTPPYLHPSSSSPPPTANPISISPKSDSPVNAKITSKLIRDGPVPPGLNLGRRGSVPSGGSHNFNMTAISSSS